MPYFTEVQRYQIEHDIRAGMSNWRIAGALGCSERKLEREIARCGTKAQYRAVAAQAHRARCAASSAANHPLIAESEWEILESAVRRKVSPEQAKREFGLLASLSGIYSRLRREGKKPVLTQLRHYKASQKRRRTTGMAWVGSAQSIHDRPIEVNVRDRMGHLEGDSIVGRRNEPYKIVVLLDRALRYVRLGWVPDGTAAGVASHFERWRDDATGIPMLTVTTDQGYEFSALPALLPKSIYACDPGKPYQKGQVEHMNQLIRQYIPKGVSLRHQNQTKLNWIANEINNRVVKRLGWISPATLLSQLTAAPSG